MISGARYCVMLEEEFKPTTCCKCRAMLTNEVVLHHDSTPHTKVVTVEMI
jgi:RNase P subunit RPR2